MEFATSSIAIVFGEFPPGWLLLPGAGVLTTVVPATLEKVPVGAMIEALAVRVMVKRNRNRMERLLYWFGFNMGCAGFGVAGSKKFRCVIHVV
jgi:hypothetical protein